MCFHLWGVCGYTRASGSGPTDVDGHRNGTGTEQLIPCPWNSESMTSNRCGNGFPMHTIELDQPLSCNENWSFQETFTGRRLSFACVRSFQFTCTTCTTCTEEQSAGRRADTQTPIKISATGNT